MPVPLPLLTRKLGGAGGADTERAIPFLCPPVRSAEVLDALPRFIAVGIGERRDVVLYAECLVPVPGVVAFAEGGMASLVRVEGRVSGRWQADADADAGVGGR